MLLACFACDDPSPSGDHAGIRWRADLGEEGGWWQGMPVAIQGHWVGFAFGRVRAFDRESGEAVWETTLTARSVGAAQNVAVAEGVAVLAEGDTVYGVSVTDGSVRWRFVPTSSTDLGDAYAGEGTAYFGTRDHRVYAVNLVNGTERWNVDVGPGWPFLGVVRGVVRAGDTLYVAVAQWLDLNGSRERGHIVALDATDGTELWRSVGDGDWNTVTSAPRVSGRLLLAADLLSGFFAVDRFSGNEVWRVRTAEFAFGATQAPVVGDGIAFAAAQGGVYAVDLETGELRWKREDLLGARAAALCGGVLLVQHQRIQVLEPQSGGSLGQLLADPEDFPTSDIAVDGDEAFVVGSVAAYGLTCG